MDKSEALLKQLAAHYDHIAELATDEAAVMTEYVEMRTHLETLIRKADFADKMVEQITLPAHEKDHFRRLSAIDRVYDAYEGAAAWHKERI